MVDLRLIDDPGWPDGHCSVGALAIHKRAWLFAHFYAGDQELPRSGGGRRAAGAAGDHEPGEGSTVLVAVS